MQQDSNKARRVVFLKLRRTGGTTIAGSILFPYCEKYGLRYMVPQGWFAAHPRLVPGDSFHMMFRHFPDYPQPWARNWLQRTIGDYKTITVLRDPVDRAVSVINHMAFHFGLKTLDQYFQYHHEDNHQSRWLGYDGQSEDFLEQKFDAIGVTERLTESILLFRRALDLNLEDVLYKSVYRDQKKAVSRADLSDEHVNRIREADWLDVELHRRATDIVNARINEAAGFADELTEYQSALANTSHDLWAKRGPFKVGFSREDVWYEFTGQNGTIKQLRDVPP